MIKVGERNIQFDQKIRMLPLNYLLGKDQMMMYLYIFERPLRKRIFPAMKIHFVKRWV